MAIDKERLKKQNAKNVYNNSRSKKSSEIDLGQVVKNNGYKVAESTKFHLQKHISNIDVKKLRKKRITKKLRQKLKNQRQNLQDNLKGLGKDENVGATNEETADKTLSTLYYGGAISSKYVLKKSGKAIKSTVLKQKKSSESSKTSNISQTSTSFNSGNVSKKSNMLSENTSNKSKKAISPKKARYNRNRKKLYRTNKKNALKIADKISGKNKIKKQAALKSTSAIGKALIAVIAFIISNCLFFMPIILIFAIGGGGEYMNQSEMQIAYAYAASETDITKAIEYWQMLVVGAKNKHRNIPDLEEVAGKFDKKEYSVCEFMNDNNALLSFISAYYRQYVDNWNFEDAKDVITEVFNDMYTISYSLEPKQITETQTIIIPEASLPNPLPNTYTILAHNGSEYVVKISETRNITVLKYTIAENMTWDEILNKYLDDGEREEYQNFYDLKGGAIKAFSSPFAFAWEEYITSPFGYRYWDNGSTEFHKGVDFGVPHGTEELAIADGTVVKIYTGCTHDYPKDSGCGCGGNYGNYVDILTNDGNYYITYGHMAQVYVNVGDEVKNGQIIGTAGCTGWSTGNHLHLELRMETADGELIDPLTFIQPYMPVQQPTTSTSKGD